MAKTKVTCRGCGDWGYETADDPCPGLCPDCFVDALSATVETSVRDRWFWGLPFWECVERQRRRLEAIGCTPAAQQRYLRKCEQVWADDQPAGDWVN
jgi:hypothetical protein